MKTYASDIPAVYYKDGYYPINYNDGYYACMKNELVSGKQNLTIREFRLVRLLITQIVKQATDFKTYVVRIEDLAKFLEIDSSNLYRDVESLCLQLQKRVISIKTDNPKQPWRNFNWLEQSEYDGHGNIIIMLSNQLRPYLLELNEFFTQYQFKEIVDFTSVYAARIYELILMKIGEQQSPFRAKSDKTSVIFSIEELREMLDCENKFAQNSQFKDKIISKAVEQINKAAYTKFLVNVTYTKSGRAYSIVHFNVEPKETLLASVS